MSFETIRQTIESLFEAGWAGQTPVAYDGVEFQTPVTAWVRVSIQFADKVQASMGSRKTWRTTGAVVVQCFSPYGNGSKEALTLADNVAAIFQGIQSGGITFRGTSAVTNDADREWWQVNSTTTFFSDELI